MAAYLIEIFPYAQRARGIAIFQFWGKAAQFFGTNVNPIGMFLLFSSVIVAGSNVL